MGGFHDHNALRVPVAGNVPAQSAQGLLDVHALPSFQRPSLCKLGSAEPLGERLLVCHPALHRHFPWLFCRRLTTYCGNRGFPALTPCPRSKSEGGYLVSPTVTARIYPPPVGSLVGGGVK